MKHTRTRPRHAWTNGFVERLQGTILAELLRVEFRRRFLTSTHQLRVALDRYLGFYNHDGRISVTAARSAARW